MNNYAAIAEKINDADAILVGACNGFSITEGIHLFGSNQAFFDLFGDFAAKYGLRNILQGMMGAWPTEEEKWAFWSRLAHRYCAGYEKSSLMADLQAIIGSKDHFILTTNGECHFEMAGFAQERIYEVEGTWLEMQCSRACHDTLYPCQDLMEQMAAAEENGRIPSDLVPHCPHCGAPMQVHMEVGQGFIPNTAGAQNFQEFLAKYAGKKLVILELGVGPRNQLVKMPLMRLTASEPFATYATFNLSDIVIPPQIADKSFAVEGYLNETVSELRQACGK